MPIVFSRFNKPSAPLVVVNKINYKFIVDNKSNIANPYGDKINTSENYEMEYWSNKFGVSVERLKTAIKAVGNSVAVVEEHLKIR